MQQWWDTVDVTVTLQCMMQLHLQLLCSTANFLATAKLV